MKNSYEREIITHLQNETGKYVEGLNKLLDL